MTERFFGTCVVDTLASIASEISGATVDDELAMTLREQDWKRQKGEKGVEAQEMVRADKKSIVELVCALINNPDSAVGKILSNCDVNFESGNEEMIVGRLHDDCRVGVIVDIIDQYADPPETMHHMFHVGLNEDGDLIDLSDIPNEYNLTYLKVASALGARRLNRMINFDQERNEGWNMVVIRSH